MTNYTTQSKTGVPAIMRGIELSDMLRAAQNESELMLVQRLNLSEQANYKPGLWDWYEQSLTAAYNDKLRLFRVLDLKNQRTYS